MKLGIILAIIFFVSCASKAPKRKVASVIDYSIPIDHQKSSVHIYPAVAENQGIWYYFYLQLRDTKGNFVDCDPSAIELKTTKGYQLEYKYERSGVGRYYFSLKKTAQITSAQMDFFVNGKPLNEHFKLEMSIPDKTNSTIKILSNMHHVIKFQLRLADNKNRPIETLDLPEILMEGGHGMIEGMKQTGKGIWEFDVVYPEVNQIMYFSVRSQGVLLPKLFRYQHIEK